MKAAAIKRKKNRIRRRRLLEGGAVVAIVVQACAAQPSSLLNRNPASSSADQQAEAEAAAPGTYFQFHFSDAFSLTSPDPETSCAGDVKTFYDLSQSGTSPVPFASDILRPELTIKPSFIKNVSLDLTDANAEVPSNRAFACSHGTGPSLPPTSSCATFDYGALGGIPTTLGGTMMIFGGVRNYDYSGRTDFAAVPAFPTFRGPSLSCGVVDATHTTLCEPQIFALGADALPPSADNDPTLVPGVTGATGPISTWENLTGVAGYAGPAGAAGASMAYSQGSQKVLVVGGAAPVVPLSTTSAGVDQLETWVFDLRTQSWQKTTDSSVDPAAITTQLDDSQGSLQQLSKSVSPRSLFGFVAAPAMSVSEMSTDGTVVRASAGAGTSARLDATDRLLIAGGLTADGPAADTLKFNPTFGPELMDTLGRTGGTGSGSTVAAGSLVQWVDASPTQLLSNGATGSWLNPPLQTAPTGSKIVNFAMAPATESTACGGGNFCPTIGRAVGAGGFDFSVPKIGGAQGTGVTGVSGGLFYLDRSGGNVGLVEGSNVIGAPNDPTGLSLTPIQWSHYFEQSGVAPANNAAIPWYGGATLLPGFDLTSNDVVYFGGSSCRDYLTDTTLDSIICDMRNPGRYLSFSPPPGGTISGAPSVPTAANFGWNGTSAPYAAGMAAARGEDGAGNVLIVAWGGAFAPGFSASGQTLYLLVNEGNTNPATPTWYTKTIAAVYPPGLVNAQLVYSHVTRKYYLFGGYQTGGFQKSVADTWELTITGTCQGGAPCAASWRQLNVSGGLSCYPSCPQARRSHRMAEVAYNRLTLEQPPAGGATVTPAVDCSNVSAPCSFAIFMQGGTPDGFQNLSDRWMFDPTANGGWGHWQKADTFPPRHSAAMASVDYFVPSLSKTVHRAVLFGGETALQNPSQAPQGYFVPPTLGDTFMYDFDNNSWNRVQLFGKGYYSSAPAFTDENSRRESYLVDGAGFHELQVDAPQTYALNPHISELAPPPLAGASMVTRTFPRGLNGATGPVAPLAVPEVFLFGGRTKDGKFNTLDHVYKFCAGSPGEKPSVTNNSITYDDASCDAQDSTKNPDSLAPVPDYAGRWLRKAPQINPPPAGPTGSVDPSTYGAYLGAAAYDPDHDLIVQFGGLSANAPVSAHAVTDLANLTANNAILEYTPPSKLNTATSSLHDGFWTSVAGCTGYTGATGPAGRYGHTMSYDSLRKQLVVVGGYDQNGVPLTQSQTYPDGTNYVLPEVWTARRVDDRSKPPADVPTVANPTDLDPCYYWKPVTTFGNSIYDAGQVPPMTALGYATSVYLPGTGYNTGYYSMLDDQCTLAGPIISGDPNVNKLLAGGVYIDIDRSQLGDTENLLLNLTYLPIGKMNMKSSGDYFTSSESAVLKVHLIRTGLTADAVRSAPQPRYLEYGDTQVYPQVVQSLAVMAPVGSGGVRQDQLLIPLSLDPSIDRIRIERYSGSAILIDATLYRMGHR